jgi:hypothetical protein
MKDRKELTTEQARRLDIEWAALVAIREMLGITRKGHNSPTYDQSLEVARTLIPGLYDPETSLIGNTREQQIIQEYRERAEAESNIEGRIVEPLDIVNKQISHYNQLLNTGNELELTRKRLHTYEDIRRLLAPKKYSETQLIIRDIQKVERKLPTPPIDHDTYRDFRISDDRGLRIRLLHPDKPEHSTGADLIYEQYWDKKKMGRLALVQYKIWNGKTLYLSQADNLEKQMAKLKTEFCDANLCKAYEGSARLEAYRLPYCSVFLRPTDKLQQPDSRFISSGIHVPICAAIRSMEDTGRGGKKIVSKKVRSEAITHKIFEELFNTNMLGSRWMTYEEIEDLYRKHKILESGERLVIHAQEFGLG